MKSLGRKDRAKGSMGKLLVQSVERLQGTIGVDAQTASRVIVVVEDTLLKD